MRFLSSICHSLHLLEAGTGWLDVLQQRSQSLDPIAKHAMDLWLRVGLSGICSCRCQLFPRSLTLCGENHPLDIAVGHRA